ncbi:slipin family protein [Phytoactinopolyspora halotolerans]|uniref:Slipin family protein n=1 Tax=Phytoactinopolyspora halotolerans TaxID=1981512 RepID=A0A6L9S1V7_9ACTN|nr:slipin family protein [Phytoactinopolyspora halotolerans]NED99052.1 slipin family protein [Phytoactinopolyspora halotolerans]
MNETTWIGLGLAVLVVLLILAAAIKIVPEYERGVVLRLGRVQGAKGPGLVVIIPIIDRMIRVDLRVITTDVPPQDIITADNVTVRVDAVTYFKVVEPVRSVVSIFDYRTGTSRVAQTTLRSALGQRNLDELLMKRDEINQQLQQAIDEVTDPWGVKVTLVEVKDVNLEESMRRAMARQAEAERDRRARVIHALGEKEAAENLGEAAKILEVRPAAMQLRTLGSLVDAASRQGTTLVFPVPIELLRLSSAGDGQQR